MMNNFRKQNGITMVALIVTVIVLIILCGIVLSYAVGDNGILEGALRGRIMNRVQSLDDAIKAYSIKNDDIYSSRRKTISDLVGEHILYPIKMTEERTIYYVSNDGLKLLGLKFKGNEFPIDTEKEYSDEELNQMGIYVVDNSLNAAYLRDGKVYGKLINFGVDLNIEGEGMYNGKVVHVKPQQVIDNASELIVVLDTTSSMQEQVVRPSSTSEIGYSEDGTFQINRDDYEAGYNLTRWAETVKAMDLLVDAYLTEGNTLKTLTIVTYSGKSGSYNITFNSTTDNAEAKQLYQNIYTVDHYRVIGEKTKSSRPNNPISLKYAYSNPTWFTSANLPASGIGSGTCTPEVVHRVLNYINDKKDANIPMDVILMSDGNANVGSINDMKRDANLIVNTEVGGRTVGLYGVGLTSEANNFKDDLGTALLADNYYSADQSGLIAEAFQSIVAIVNQKEQTTQITTGELSGEYENVFEVIIDVYSSENSNIPHITQDYVPNGSIYNLNTIYDENNKVNVEHAFDIIDNDVNITEEYDTIDIHILYR